MLVQLHEGHWGRESIEEVESLKVAIRRAAMLHSEDCGGVKAVLVNGVQVMNRQDIWRASIAFHDAHHHRDSDWRRHQMREWQRWCAKIRKWEQD